MRCRSTSIRPSIASLKPGSTPNARKRAPPGSHRSVYCLYSIGTPAPSVDRLALSTSYAVAASRPSNEGGRSEERRVGKECVSTCRSRWSRYHEKKKERTEEK